jgi:polysaccharide pyruvyl transferase WcaK-like protein
MRILIEPSGYACRNMGDLAMLQVAVERLQRRWPEAEIAAFTAAPERLRYYAPGVVLYSPQLHEQLLAAHLNRRMPFATRAAVVLRRLQAMTAPRNWRRICRVTGRFLAGGSREGLFAAPQDWPGREGKRRLLRSFSLVVVSGAGCLADPFLGHAWRVLELIEAAVAAGVPTVLFGQGIGPLENPALRAKARAVLPRVDFVGLRESRKSFGLLRKLGVPAGRIRVGGDDTIEFAYRQRGQAAGECLGVNLRLARYSRMNRALASAVLKTVVEFAQRRAIEVVPVPISFDEHEADLDALARLRQISPSEPVPEEPAAVVRLVGRCRFLVTGSYHGAVFALAQGIPVVAVSNSRYYDDKFLGLAELFGAGCEVVRLGEPGALERLHGAMEGMAGAGEDLRGALLRSAVKQIALSHAAYDEAFEIVSAGAAPAGLHSAHSAA